MTRRLAVLGFSLLALTGCPRSPSGQPTPLPGPTPIPTPTPTPPPYVPARRVDTGKIFNGMKYRVELETEFGTTATEERNNPESYMAELIFKVKVPKPHQDLEAISKLNTSLPTVLPALEKMLETAKVSQVFDDLYRFKCAELKLGMDRLDRLTTRHNFYDCETALELQHPETKRRALFIMADMDVDTDGSDVDRVAEIAGASSTFQPVTSYRWPKKTEAVSPLVPVLETKIKDLEAELAGTITATRRAQIQKELPDIKSELHVLQKYRFLIGHADPFIVLPGNMFIGTRTGPYATSIGDYCVVIYDNVLYPAVVGDAGPRARMGEASLRICKQILPKANGDFRPVTDLKATYFVFPGTADKPYGPPDLEKWRTKCAKLLDEIGGHQGELFAWEDITKPKTPPAPPAATPVPGQPSALSPAPKPAPTAP